MHTTEQLAFDLVLAVIADKQRRHISPDYALQREIYDRLNQALDNLVADGTLIQRLASVNRHPAYQLPQSRL